MNNIEVSLFKKTFTRKPSNAETALLSTIIAEKKECINRDNIKALARLVGENGLVFCPATFKNGVRNKEGFDQLQLLALDFDNKDPDNCVSFEEVKKRADRYDLPILFAYDTFTSIKHNKFRAVFLNDASIPDRKTAEAAYQALYTMFPEADPCCKDVSRMYFGGKGLLHFDESIPEINLESLFRNMTYHLKDKYGDTNYKRKIERFSKDTGIVLNDKKLLDIRVTDNLAEDIGVIQNNKNSTNPYIVNKGFGEKLSKYYIINFDVGYTTPLSENRKPNSHLLFRSSVLRDIALNCLLYREFEAGDRKLHHNELFGLATNIIQVESGSKRFMEILRSTAHFDDRPEKYSAWEHNLSYLNRQRYKPESCASFCPYSGECHHGSNILSTAKIKYHQMERLANYEECFVSIEEAEEDFKRHFINAMEADDKRWHIIKAQTAIGKTEMYLNLIRDVSKQVLIAVPTNKLKHEICERALSLGFEIIESPSLHEFKDELPDDVWDRIQNLYNSGKSVIPFLKKMIAEDNPECAAIFKQYLREMDKFNGCECHAITTHRRLLTMDVHKYDFVIVDEDIIYSAIIPNKTDIPVSDLRRVKKKLPPNSLLERKLNKTIKLAKTSNYFTLPKIQYERDDDDKPMGVDLPSFCSATRFCSRKASDGESNLPEDCISFLNPVEFCDNVKYIMLSATADETMCGYIFGEDNITFYDSKKARHTGTLNQHYSRSLSRADMKKDADVIDRIREQTGFKHTITFKKYNFGDQHFGNCAGCDHLKGENIDVIGTPHQPEWIYKLFAYTHAPCCDVYAKISPSTPVTHNGYKFRFTTYNDEALRAIQFYMIESELEQAVGRARLLRCACTVNLFSNFPLCQAVMKESEY